MHVVDPRLRERGAVVRGGGIKVWVSQAQQLRTTSWLVAESSHDGLPKGNLEVFYRNEEGVSPVSDSPGLGRGCFTGQEAR